MQTNIAAAVKETPPNIIPLALAARPKPARRKCRYRVIEFRNNTGSKSWRVAGYKPGGSRVRENFADVKTAQCRQLELEAESLKQPTDKAVRATSLSEDALRVAEFAMLKLGDDWARLPDCVDYWLKAGGKTIPTDSPRIDDAVGQYLDWLKKAPLREASKGNRKFQINVFQNSVPNIRLPEATPEFIEKFLDGRKVSPATRNFYKKMLSVFFSWCIERPRRWINSNPCREIRIDLGEQRPPAVLTVAECRSLLGAAESHADGLMAPYVAVCLFGGLRPTEAQRLTWGQVNFHDGEIRLEAAQTKTGRGRMVKICPTLAAWLRAYQGKPFYPAGWRKGFAAVKEAAGLKEWTPDVMRHTAISHFFRKCGSYGFTGEQFGNSEAVIKSHYQGRVSSEDTRAFFRLMPKACQ